MTRRHLIGIALFLLGLGLGWISAHLFVSNLQWLSYAGVAFAAFGAGILATLAVLDYPARPPRTPPQFSSEPRADETSPPIITDAARIIPRRRASPSPNAEQVTTPWLAPIPAAPSVRPVRVYWLSPHVALTRTNNRFHARLNDVAGYEYIKFSVGLSRDWRGGFRRRNAAQESIWRPAVLFRPSVLAWLVFGLSLFVFALTRLVALDQFPIYFFSDEAIHPVLGTELIQRGMRDAQGRWFPPYFQNGSIWNLSLSVYIHAVSAWLFGVSIWVTRATNALIALSSAAAVGLTLKYIFNIRWWWLGALVLAAIPAWFLHSRTGFETVLMVSFYGWFLFAYLLYRYRNPRFLYAALVFAAATFYSYANGQVIIAVTAILLAGSDWRYHRQHRRVLVRGALLLAFLAIPYLRFRFEHPDVIAFQLHVVDSYWLKPLPLQDKLQQFIQKYSYGASPLYWFLPNSQDLVRHRMKEYGHIVWWLLPFFLIGLGVCLARFKSSAHRVLLIALVAAPVGSALADILVTRALLFVVPAAMLCVLGLDFLITRLREIRWQWAAASAATAGLIVFSLTMLNDAVLNGPLWYDNYGMGGMQWGARQLFEILKSERQRNPGMTIYVTSTWANGTDVFPRFFIPNDRNTVIRTIDTWIDNAVPLSQELLFVVTPTELERAKQSGKFQEPVIERVLDYPNGAPGFYFARFRYVPDVEKIFERERQERAKPVTSQVVIAGEKVRVIHSRMDYGQVQDMFDGNSLSLSRGLEANPLVIELQYPSPRAVRGISALFGKMNFRLTVSLFPTGVSEPTVYAQTVTTNAETPQVSLRFENPPASVERVRVEIQNLDAQGAAKIHVRELEVR